MRLKGKTAIITGGAGGIGAAGARAMAAEGAEIIITDLADGAAVADSVGGLYIKHDVTSQDGWGKVVALAANRYGKVDVLVNAAGIEGDLAEGTPLGSYAAYKNVLAVNLDGTYLGVQAILPMMMGQGTGSIINISSMAAFLGTPFSLPYGVSKAAVWQLSRSVASFAALGGHKIRCNSVHPGLIRTRMTDTIFNAIGAIEGTSAQVAEQTQLDQVPMGYRAEPEEVAPLLVYLASDEASYVTGSEFKVDGGWSLNNPRANAR